MELGRHDARGTVLWHQVLESLRIARLTVIIKKCLPKTGKLEYPHATSPRPTMKEDFGGVVMFSCVQVISSL